MSPATLEQLTLARNYFKQIGGGTIAGAIDDAIDECRRNADAVRCPNCDNLRLELGVERRSMRAYRILRVAVEAMIAQLGYHGSIAARDDRVQAVMDALAQIDDLENEGNPIKWSAILESLRDKDKGGPV